MLDGNTVAYIQNCMQKGYSIDSIKEVLIKTGYSSHEVNLYFESLNTNSNVSSQNKNEENIVSYIRDQLSKGFDKDQIRNSLRNVNYSNKEIDAWFNQINVKNNKSNLFTNKSFLIIASGILILFLLISGFFVVKGNYVSDLFDEFKNSNSFLGFGKDNDNLESSTDVAKINSIENSRKDNLINDDNNKKNSDDINKTNEVKNLDVMKDDDITKLEEEKVFNESLNVTEKNLTADLNISNTSNTSSTPSFVGGGGGSGGGSSSSGGGGDPVPVEEPPESNLTDDEFIELIDKFIFRSDEDQFVRVIFQTNLDNCKLEYSNDYVKDVSSFDVIELLNNRENLNLWKVCCENKCI
jgi:hypothetical protein